MVVPEPGRKTMLMLLHEGHQGMCRMKALARMYVWWPGINADIEVSVGGCYESQQNQSTPPAAPLNPWSWPTCPWARLHLDFAGPFLGQMFFILIDAHSKWIEAYETASATSTVVMQELKTTFVRFFFGLRPLSLIMAHVLSVQSSKNFCRKWHSTYHFSTVSSSF